jgi:hypothetical protein
MHGHIDESAARKTIDHEVAGSNQPNSSTSFRGSGNGLEAGPLEQTIRRRALNFTRIHAYIDPDHVRKAFWRKSHKIQQETNNMSLGIKPNENSSLHRSRLCDEALLAERSLKIQQVMVST